MGAHGPGPDDMADETDREPAVPGSGAPDGGAARLPAPESGPDGVDLGRRRFFRQFASDLIQGAATVAGEASEELPPRRVGVRPVRVRIRRHGRSVDAVMSRDPPAAINSG